MTTSKPEPLFVQAPRPRCPVCGEVTYSRAGIHPQCAQERSDAEQKERLKEAADNAEDEVDDLKAWHRRCPSCNAQVHIRRDACECGHVLRRKPEK